MTKPQLNKFFIIVSLSWITTSFAHANGDHVFNTSEINLVAEFHITKGAVPNPFAQMDEYSQANLFCKMMGYEKSTHLEITQVENYKNKASELLEKFKSFTLTGEIDPDTKKQLETKYNDLSQLNSIQYIPGVTCFTRTPGDDHLGICRELVQLGFKYPVDFNFPKTLFKSIQCSNKIKDTGYSFERLKEITNPNYIGFNNPIEEQDKNLAHQLLENKKFFRDPELYQALGQDTERTIKILSRWHRDKAESLIKRVQAELGEKHLPLLINPGIVSQLEKFLQFAQKEILANPQISTLELIEKYGDQDKVRIYRALRLKPESVEKIKNDGIYAMGLLRSPDAVLRSMAQTLSPQHYRECTPHSPLEEIEARLRGATPPTRYKYMSASHHELVSIAAAQGGVLGKTTEDGDIYIFELEIPRDYLVYQEGVFSNTIQGTYDFIKDGKTTTFNLQDSTIEVMIPFLIENSFIKNVRKYEGPVIKMDFKRKYK